MANELEILFTDIANEVRKKKGTTALIKATDLPSEIESIPTGSGEDMLQTKVDSVNNCDYLFYKYFGDSVDFISGLNTSKVTSMTYMFSSCTAITTIPQLDTSEVTDMSYMFQYCYALTMIPQLNTSKVTKMTYMFEGCRKLTMIPQLNTSKVTTMSYMFKGCTELITIPQLDMSKVTYVTSMFSDCKKLTNLTLLNINVNLQVGDRTNYGHLLTVESLVGLCKECIDVGASRTLTIGSANIEKLADVYVKLTGEAEENETLPKHPIIQCESADEGAMLISDYMASKGWVLA